MPIHIPSGDYACTTEAAKIIGMSTGRLRELCRLGEIRTYALSERVVLIPMPEVRRVKQTESTTGRPRGH